MPPRIKPASSWGMEADPREDWRERAACREVDPEMFFLINEGDLAAVGRAKAWCAICPVRRQCLAQGMHEGFGIWGGLTALERRGLARRRVGA